MRKPHHRARWPLALAVTLLLGLVLATATQASSGIVGYFQLGDEFEGSLSNNEQEAKAGDADVNADGAGGASPGDVYVTSGNSSAFDVRQLSAADDLTRMWGSNTVKSGPGQANETQAVRVDAAGGAFKLGFGGSTTVDIQATATAAQVEAALDGLPSIGPGGVSVSGGPGDVGGTAPYIVSFVGPTFGGADQPQLKATNGSVPLNGGGATLSTYGINNGGNGFEICDPHAGDECQDLQSGSAGRVAVDQVTGDVFITNQNGIEKYSATGQFLRAWGRDVVAAGPDDSSVDEQTSVTVVADGGTFTLGYRKSGSAPVQSTPPLPYNASAATIESALNKFNEIGGNYSSVSVTAEPEPGGQEDTRLYLITFHGLLGGDDLGGDFGNVLVSNPNGLTIDSGSKSADVETAVNGGGYEVCKASDACKEGSILDSPNALALRTFGANIALAPAGAPNAGNVIASDAEGNRVQEFDPEGAFIRTFGWNVDATDPSTGFEVCTAASGHVCQAGSGGSGVGQLPAVSAVGEDSTGALYTVESQRIPSKLYRVQKFSPAGGLDLTPSFLGSTETQRLTINADSGQFRLIFRPEADLDLPSEPSSVEGTGDVEPGSKTITNVVTTSGAFEVGVPIISPTFSSFFPPHSIITAVGANTITISKPVAKLPSTSGKSLSLRSTRFYKTPDLPFDASAAEVEAALNALPSINADGGSVSVSGGPGDPSGSSPYSVVFGGGPLARTDAPQMTAVDGAVPLSGGSGATANTAKVTTTTPGGPWGVEGNDRPLDLTVAPGDFIFIAKNVPTLATTCADGLPSPPEIRVEKLDSSGTVLETSDPCDGLRILREEATNRRSALTVNPLTGNPYLLNQNFAAEDPRINVFRAPGPQPNLTLDPVSGLGATAGTISGTIDPNGPGTSYPDTTGTPSATKTTYRVEYKRAVDSEWTRYTPDVPLSSGTDPVPFSVGVAGLEPKTEYELKVVVVKPFTGTVEDTASFTTLPGAPEIEAVSASDVSAAAAVLHAKVNPRGSETSYHFEYGPTPAYGSSTQENAIGDAHSGQPVQDQIGGLSDSVYHFRIVATNPSGTIASPDQTFTFHPPVCPNQTVRQQTGAAYLPDCRAYELVSPQDAGGTALFTGGPQSPYASNPPRLAFVGQLAAIPGSGRNPINTAGDLYIATRSADGWRSRYVGPSSEEAGCAGGRPLVAGAGPPTTIQNDVIADPSLGRVIDWNLGNPLECAFGWFGGLRLPDTNTSTLGSNAPYVWNANGDFLDRWPTSAADVPGSEDNFACPQNPEIKPSPPGSSIYTLPVSYFCSTYVDASKDLNHFVFSTQSGLFGEGGLTAAPGSAYDNDTVHNTLALISKQPNGAPIAQEPGAKAGPEELIRFPSVSSDGSHILMATATKPECKQLDFPFGGQVEYPYCPIVTEPAHLYMRVNDAVSYDVSAGKAVKYIGATPDGKKVYFTSDEQLTGDDTDTSTDLYMWSENGGSPQLTRISAGNSGSAGNTDNCASSWTDGCDIVTYDDSNISTAAGNRGGLGTWAVGAATNPGYTDNAIAAKSGDIYFYSPEQLVAGLGVPGKENLYVYRNGSVRFVAALEDDPYCLPSSFAVPSCSDGAAGRLQVTPDGRFAAFITTTSVTSYDSHGFAEMYRFDAEAGKVACVSCRPDGSAPTNDVLGSQGGRFLTDDGRPFFTTTEPLEERDSNAGVDRQGKPIGHDVYEFVEGRPQLITSGTGTGPASVGYQGLGSPGLYGVSADGTDAYFGTLETLVGQDHNGAQIKFYDARTNGGFSFVPPPAPCAAADECHGATSTAPAPLASGTGAALGAGGNDARVHKKRKHGKKRKQRKHRRAAAHRAGGVR